MSATKKQIEDAKRIVWDHLEQTAMSTNEVRFVLRHVNHFASALVDPDHLIIPRSYLTALETLLAAGCSVGVSDGRWAAEHVWQDAENEKDAAKEEMGL